MKNKTTQTPGTVSLHTLGCGLRCVHLASPSDVEYLGVSVNVGSRDDAPGLEGLAHFVEHTIFKGTTRRRSWHIINRMESCGGELNAYTTKETTVVYSLFPAGYAGRAVELIADLITGSVFPQKEIDREREVVADEISSYLDMPSESVFDDFEDLIFAGSGLGHNILGTQESLPRFTPEICRRYLTDFYTAPNMVLFYSGPADAEKIWRIAERYFGAISVSEAPFRRTEPAAAPTFRTTRQLDIHQTHTVAGARIPGMKSEMRHPMALLTNIIGGPGMNSLLNVELREKRGLVYSVDTSTAMLTDCGLFTIYFGCDPEDLGRCRRLIDRTMYRLASTPLTAQQLERAKKQYIGQLTVSADNRESQILAIARATLYYGRPFTAAQRIEAIRAITPEQIMDAAQMIEPERLSSLTFR